MENQIFKKTCLLKDDWKGDGPLKKQILMRAAIY